MSNKYVTTAIPYVNGKPHLGHAVDYLLADVYARYQKQQGNTVRFQVGTDEHGNKVFAKAEEEGIPIQQYVDTNAKKFQEFIYQLGVDYTDFIRTTSPDHKRRCQNIWNKLSSHIYRGTYEGWYCEGCERFVCDKECEETGGICPDHSKPHIRLSEENYYLRIADFKDRIKEAITNDELIIFPEFRKNEFLNLLADMPDVSISRPKKQLTWGVPVPGDDDQVMYVWIDALCNYITVLGYSDQDISDYWPASVQVIGKDILRFHAGIWPAILLGIGLPLPKVLLTHGFITVDGAKMSKSIGNVIDPIDVLEHHGVDAFRYYFLRHVDTFNDSDFTWDKFEAAYNNELANDLGNLAQRLATMCEKYEYTPNSPQTNNNPRYEELMNSFHFSEAFNLVWDDIQSLNKYIDDKKPWAVSKNGDEKELHSILDHLVSGILSVATRLNPFLPETSTKLAAIFSTEKITQPDTPLFPKSK
jgi:methionyl-tRNA synthetase